MEYSKLVEVYETISKTTKRLEKMHNISLLLKNTSVDELETIILLLQGKIFHDYDETKIGMSQKLILKAINKSTGADISKIESEWKKTGDLGLVSFNLINKKTQVALFTKDLSIKKVYDNIRKLATLTGEGTVDKKISLVSELLTSATPLEAKYIVRTVLEELRVGIGEGTLRDAIVWAYFGEMLGLEYNLEENDLNLDDEKRRKYIEVVEIFQNAYDLTNDFSIVAKVAKLEGINGLKNIMLTPGKPIKVMLCQKANNIKDGFESVGSPAQIEYKYDGFRMQIHSVDSKITIYTRRLENITRQFPEVVEYIKNNVKGKDFLIDGEAVGFDPKTGKYLPFQNVSQRIKRKYDIEEIAKNFPIELNLFDILFYDGASLIKMPLYERRKLLESIVTQVNKKIVIAKVDITSDLADAEKFYKDALLAGNEGIIMKRHDSFYKPGSRVGGWVKVKPVMESLDVVIVGAEWGEGKRASWLTSFTVAIQGYDGEFLEIGKVGTGIKELEQVEKLDENDKVIENNSVTFDELTRLLQPLIISEDGREVKLKPKIVIELNYEEIQASTNYSSGFALRFPRLIRLRDDKGSDDASTLEMVKEFYNSQRGRKN